jgi:hypothetical protein
MIVALVREAIVILYPRTPALPGVEDCDLDPFLERFREESPPLVWLGIVLGSIIFHLSPIFTVYIPLPAPMLSPAAADRHAERIASSSIYLVRQTIFLVKFAAGLAWGAHPSVREKFALPKLPEDPGTWRTS